jgi:hypothetical protein
LTTNTALTLDFPSVSGKEVTVRFDGGDITSDAGAILLGQADRKTGLLDAVAAVLKDNRQAAKVLHPLVTLMRQRVIGIACGYEDANDFDTLASDPALKIACRRAPKTDGDLASQPTISRLENRVSKADVLAMACEIARTVMAQLPRRTDRIILDLDAYEDPCHGQQEFQFFNSHYDSHCYLPLVLFLTANDGVQRPLGALLRSGKGGQAGVRWVIRLAVDLIRARFPQAKIILRADSGFGNARVLHLCDRMGISYCLGLASNSRLQTLSTRAQVQTCLRYSFRQKEWRSQSNCHLFDRFDYKAGSWSRKRRVVAKVENTDGKLKTHFVVTDLFANAPAHKAHAFYCKRGDAENRIKEFKLDLFAGRTSCHRFLANQFRLLLHVAAAVLVNVVQQAAKETPYHNAQASTLRVRLFKIGARVVESTRRIWLHLSSGYPHQDVWHRIYRALVT